MLEVVKRFLAGGSAVWCKLSLSLNREDDNSPEFIGVVEDISDKKTTEESLRRSQAMLSIAGKTAKLGGWMIELPSQVFHWSEELRAICEVFPDFEPTIAKSLEFCPVEYRDEFKEQITDCLRYGVRNRNRHQRDQDLGARGQFSCEQAERNSGKYH